MISTQYAGKNVEVTVVAMQGNRGLFTKMDHNVPHVYIKDVTFRYPDATLVYAVREAGHPEKHIGFIIETEKDFEVELHHGGMMRLLQPVQSFMASAGDKLVQAYLTSAEQVLQAWTD